MREGDFQLGEERRMKKIPKNVGSFWSSKKQEVALAIISPYHLAATAELAIGFDAPALLPADKEVIQLDTDTK